MFLRLILFLLLCLLVSPCQSTIFVQTTGGGSPPGGTLLVGSDTALSGTSTKLVGGYAYSFNGTDGWSAVASGDIAKGYFYINGWWGCGSGEYVKMLVYNSSLNLHAQSATVECGTQSAGWIEFTFSSGSITSGQTYHLAFIADDYLDLMDNSTSDQIYQDAGTVASPPSALATGYNIGRVGYAYLEN